MTDVTQLPAGVLRHLAAIADTRSRVEVIDAEATAADILALGGRPALGFWRARVRRTPPGGAAPPSCPPPTRLGPHTATDLVLAADDLSALRISLEAKTATLLWIADRSGLSAYDLSLGYGLLFQEGKR